MIKFGQVCEYNEAKGVAKIHYVRPDACEKCGGCGSKPHTGSIELKADCKVGDWVRVELPEGRFLQATAIAYVIPLIGLLVGLAGGYLLGGGTDGPTVLGALLGLALSFGVLWLNEKRISGRPEWTPRVTAVYAEKPTIDDIGCHQD